MEKTITIDGKEIRLKANAMLPLIYRNSFSQDIFKVQGTLFGLIGRGGINLKGIEDVDCVGIMQIIWCMAKAADQSVPKFEEWLDGFETFPIFDVFEDVLDLFMVNIATTSKIKNADAAEDSQLKG